MSSRPRGSSAGPGSSSKAANNSQGGSSRPSEPRRPASADGDVGSSVGASGRVNVFARVRPLGPKDAQGSKGEGVQTTPDGEESWILLRQGPTPGGVVAGGGVAVAKDKPFVFDGVFDARCTQKQVYDATTAPILRDVLLGYHGTVLAYGQTGSGKTHTMLSLPERGSGGEIDDGAGLVARVAADLFAKIAADPGREYTVMLSVQQIYNEQIDDMLRPAPGPGDKKLPNATPAGCNLAIHKDAGSEWVVDGLTWLPVTSSEAMLKAIAAGRARLAYAETMMNKHSSRSHAVITLKISHRKRPRPAAEPRDSDGEGSASEMDAPRGKTLKGQLTIVDLAGSERVKRSQAAGQQLKEATSINSSLLVFGNVVNALATKKSHVPYRDSALTKMLESSLSGDCKTVLVVCVSPDINSLSESASSLEFASRARAIAVNPKIHAEMLAKLKPKKKKAGGRDMATQADWWPGGRGGRGGILGLLCCCCCAKPSVSPDDDED